VGDQNEFHIERFVDLEPFGDRRVPREGFILYCPDCDSEEIEEIFN